MAFVLSDRIKETTTTTSTGTYTLGGAVSGFETFTANLSNGDTTYYCCTDGTDFEVGLGTFASSGTTLARTTIISSSNSNNAVNWSSGSRDIFCTLPGSKVVFKDGDGHASFADNERTRFGSDNDAYIRHTGSLLQVISDTGSINIKTNADDQDVILQADDGSGGTTDYLRADGSSGAVKLSHYGSTKLQTTSGGVTITGALTGNVTGDVTGDVTGNVSGTAATVTGAAQSNITSVGTLTGLTTSGTINLSQTSGTAITTSGGLSSADLGILRAHAGGDTHGFTIKYMGSRSGNNNSYSLFMDNQSGTDVEAMTVLQDGKVGINNTSPSAPLDVTGDAEITGTLTAGDLTAITSDGAILSLQTSDTTVADGDTIGLIEFKAPSEASGTDAILTAASIVAEADATFAADNNQTDMVFNLGSSEAATEKMRLTHEGILTVDDGVVGKHFGGINANSTGKFRYWNSSSVYVSGFTSGYTFGGLGDSGNDGYSINWTNSNTDGRGFIWDDSGHSNSQGAMALTTNGKLTVAHSIRVGHGESDTTTPGATHVLDVGGSGIINGDLTATTSDGAILKLQTSDTTVADGDVVGAIEFSCLLYTSPSPRDLSTSRMPSSA